MVRGSGPKSARFFTSRSQWEGGGCICYDSYNFGHPNWPLGKPLPTKSKSESPRGPTSGPIIVIGEASGDEDEGKMPESPSSVDFEMKVYNDLFGEGVDI